MVDLHSHLLPEFDDGSTSLSQSVEMAEMAVADGITVMACTPHILPGVYNNVGPSILDGVARLQARLSESGIPLLLVGGADAHIAPDLIDGLHHGRVLSLNGSRFFLLEPPHHVAPPRFVEHIFDLLRSGYVPVITHPERLTWIEAHYETFRRAVIGGAWCQVTAGSLTGRFGRRPRYWAERMLDDGLVHILASDAHDTTRRPPILSEGYAAAVAVVGEEEAHNLVFTRPAGILRNGPSSEFPLPQRSSKSTDAVDGFWKRAIGFVKRAKA